MPNTKKTKKSKKSRSRFPAVPPCDRAVGEEDPWRLVYFGKDPEAALNKYLKERDDLQAGRTPRTRSDASTLRELVNHFPFPVEQRRPHLTSRKGIL
jgi:hypothetical protein